MSQSLFEKKRKKVWYEKDDRTEEKLVFIPLQR